MRSLAPFGSGRKSLLLSEDLAKGERQDYMVGRDMRQYRQTMAIVAVIL